MQVDESLEFSSKENQKLQKSNLNDYSDFNENNVQLTEASFEQFTEKYIQDHIQELEQKKQEILREQEEKIKEIKTKYAAKLEELNQALQLLTSLQTTTSQPKQQPSLKVTQTLNNNEIMLDLSSINLPFEFTPTVPYKIVDSGNKQNFQLVQTEGYEPNLYEPKNSERYLKLNIQQQLDLGRFTPFVFQPNLKK